MADIVIRGMEMPTPEHGVRTINIYADGVITNYAEEIIGHAVPLPEGHGRLGDLDALFKHLFLTDGGYIANDRDSDGWPHVCTYESIKKAIHGAPTIIPAEGDGDNA